MFNDVEDSFHLFNSHFQFISFIFLAHEKVISICPVDLIVLHHTEPLQLRRDPLI